MPQQQNNEALAHRFHMNIFQKGKLEVHYNRESVKNAYEEYCFVKL